MILSLDKLSQWLSAKSPRKKKFRLTQRNIYIFPSMFGISYLGLLILMLLTAINYQSSLIYLFTFLLGAIFFLSIWACFLNFSGLKVESVEPGRCFEGELLSYICRLSKDKQLPLSLKIGLEKELSEVIPFTLQTCTDVVITAPKRKRGRYFPERLYIETRFPFGLVLAWTWLKLDAECLVYPSPLHCIPNSRSSASGKQNIAHLSLDELNELRAYQPGDPVNRILWKKFASKDELIIREQEQGTFSPDWVDWDNYAGTAEDILRYLCFDVCKLSEASKSFGFKIPGVLYPPDSGQIHMQKCLDALALYRP